MERMFCECLRETERSSEKCAEDTTSLQQVRWSRLVGQALEKLGGRVEKVYVVEGKIGKRSWVPEDYLVTYLRRSGALP